MSGTDTVIPKSKLFPHTYSAGKYPGAPVVETHALAINMADRVIYTVNREGVPVQLGISPNELDRQLKSFRNSLEDYLKQLVPTKESLGIDKVANYGITDSTTENRSDLYASAKAVSNLNNAVTLKMEGYDVSISSINEAIRNIDAVLDGFGDNEDYVKHDQLQELGLVFTPTDYLGYRQPSLENPTESIPSQNGDVTNFMEALNHLWTKANSLQPLEILATYQGDIYIVPHTNNGEWVINTTVPHNGVVIGETLDINGICEAVVVDTLTDLSFVVATTELTPQVIADGTIKQIPNTGDLIVYGGNGKYRYSKPQQGNSDLELLNELQGQCNVAVSTGSSLAYPPIGNYTYDLFEYDASFPQGMVFDKDSCWILTATDIDGAIEHVIAETKLVGNAYSPTGKQIVIPNTFTRNGTEFILETLTNDLTIMNGVFWIKCRLVSGSGTAHTGLGGFAGFSSSGELVDTIVPNWDEAKDAGYFYSSGIAATENGELVTILHRTNAGTPAITIIGLDGAIEEVIEADDLAGSLLRIDVNKNALFVTASSADDQNAYPSETSVFDLYSGKRWYRLNLRDPAIGVNNPNANIGRGIFATDSTIQYIGAGGNFRSYSYLSGQVTVTMNGVGQLVDEGDVIVVDDSYSLLVKIKASNDVLICSGETTSANAESTVRRLPSSNDYLAAIGQGRYRARRLEFNETETGAEFDPDEFIGKNIPSVTNPDPSRPEETGKVTSLTETLNYLFTAASSDLAIEAIITAGINAGLPFRQGMSVSEIKEVFGSLAGVSFALRGKTDMNVIGLLEIVIDILIEDRASIIPRQAKTSSGTSISKANVEVTAPVYSLESKGSLSYV